MKKALAIALLSIFLMAGCATNKPEVSLQSLSGKFDYLPTTHNTSDKDKIEIIVFFGYQCPHCFRFYMSEFSKWNGTSAKDIKIRYIPVIMSNEIVPANRSFYAAENLGINPLFHKYLFAEFNLNHRYPRSESDLYQIFMSCCGTSYDNFIREYKSENTTNSMKSDFDTFKEYSVKAVPLVIVNGKYSVEPNGTNSHREMMNVISSLVDIERKNKI